MWLELLICGLSLTNWSSQAAEGMLVVGSPDLWINAPLELHLIHITLLLYIICGLNLYIISYI